MNTTDNFNISIKDIGRVAVDKNTTLFELSEKYFPAPKLPIIIAKVNNQTQDLSKTLTKDCFVEFLDTSSEHSFRAIQRSLTFLLICAVKEVLGLRTKVVVQHSVGKNYYIKINESSTEIDDDTIILIKQKMLDKIEKDVKLDKVPVDVEEAMEYFEETGLNDKLELLKYRRSSFIHLYKLDWFYNYFYGEMVYSCKYLSVFNVEKYSDGLVLVFPSPTDCTKLNPITNTEKISSIFEESSNWARILEIDTLANINQKIIDGHFDDVIRISEALQEKKMAEIADMVFNQKKKLILIAGPSSSGKTTFAHKLSIHLRVNGLRPKVISLDDYYKDRDKIPADKETGRKNFEVIESLDLELLNNDIPKLINGEAVEIPSFNFVKGIKEYKGRVLKLEESDVLILEGIHGLNEKISKNVSKEDKFKIFISALTPLNIDNHNRIPTSDSRLMRRLVRDHMFRGFTAMTTIEMWPEVLKGEIENIFPYQNEADIVFNSALIYETNILKSFVEPLLFDVSRNEKEYCEARRLVRFLESFLTVTSEGVPENSLIREFIGGSCF